jgi:hypothetical protein
MSLSVTAPAHPAAVNRALAMDITACALHIRKPTANRETLNARLRSCAFRCVRATPYWGVRGIDDARAQVRAILDAVATML